MIETRLLRQFLVVAEELHFGRAASRLHMAQPPLSQAMLKLEEKAGVTLFARNSRRVALTPAGEVFRERAQGVLNLLQSAIAEAKATASKNGVLVVSGVQFRGYDFILSSLKSVCTGQRAVQMELRQGPTSEQIAWLNAQTCDVAFLRGVDDLGDYFRHEIVAVERLYAALSSNHPLADRLEVELAELSTEGFIFPSRVLGVAYHDLLQRLCNQSGYSPTVAHEVENMQTLIGLVEAEMGVSIVPASVVAHSDGVRFVRLSDPQAQMPLFMAWRVDGFNPLLDEFVYTVRERKPCGEIVACGTHGGHSAWLKSPSQVPLSSATH